MSDRVAVALAVAVAAGAWAAWPVPVVAAAVLVAAALARSRPWLLCVGAALLASGLAARSWSGLEPPPPASVHAAATLLTDPQQSREAVRVELRLGRRRVQAFARGPGAAALRSRLAGERVEVRGRLTGVPRASRAYLARRHVGARMEVDSVVPLGAGGPLSRFANEVRRTLLRGTSSMSDDDRALFTGLVLGDDRHQSVVTRDDFRAAGLSHLLAVSGQNVAFVLMVAAPVLNRLGLRLRLLAGLVVLVAFGVLTRWEPSVLRAVTMAGISMTAATLGRPASTVRLVALAAAALILVDPLLVGSVGFVLSVGACAGIATLAGPLAGRLPGPRWLRTPVSVTLAAQAGVAPVLVTVFDGVPVSSLPANLLAAPVAGPVMVWGLVAGLPAGLAGEPVAGLVHVPTGVAVGWIDAVARWGARLPLGSLGEMHMGALVVVALVGLRAPAWRPAAAWAVPVVLLAPALSGMALAPGDAEGAPLASGARLWRSGGAVVVVVDEPDPGRLLGGLRARGVRRIDVLVVRGGGTRASRSVAPVLERVRTRAVLAPPGHRLSGAVAVRPGERARAGDLVVDVEALRPRLQVRVTRVGEGDRAPPR